MSYDLYVELGGTTEDDVNALVQGRHAGLDIPDIATRIRLLAGVAARNESVKEHAISGARKADGGYKSLVHKKRDDRDDKGGSKESSYAKELITHNYKVMQTLALLPGTVDLQALPPGSWFLQFTFTLTKPWMSKDDDPFYVADSVNPVRKDKVFKIPMMSAASWKGLLRWTAMHIRLVQQKEKLTPEQFAKDRFSQTLLFGDEKGEESGQTRDFAALPGRA